MFNQPFLFRIKRVVCAFGRVFKNIVGHARCNAAHIIFFADAARDDVVGIHMQNVTHHQLRPVNAVIRERHDIRPVTHGQVMRNFHRLRMNEIITVQIQDIFPSGDFHPRIARIRQTAIFLGHDFKATVARGVFIQNGRTVVGTAVVDANRFPVGERLV